MLLQLVINYALGCYPTWSRILKNYKYITSLLSDAQYKGVLIDGG